MLGIGLGGFAEGFDKGIGIGKKMAGTPEEQRQRRAEAATNEARQEFDANGGGSLDQFQSYLVPKVAAKHIKAGDLEGAKAWQEWATQDENRKATKSFGEGMIAAQAGDTPKALKKFIDAGRTRGYGDDYKIDEPQEIEGGGWKVNITGKDGKQFTQEFKTADDVLKFGAVHLNPEAAFKQWRDSQADATKRKGAVEDDATKYQKRKDIDIESDQKRKDLGLPKGNAQRPLQFEVIRDAYLKLGYPEKEAVDIASGRKPAKDTDLMNLSRQITTMEMPSSDMRYTSEQRRKRYEEVLKDLRGQQGSAQPGPAPAPQAPGLGPRAPATAPQSRGPAQPAQSAPPQYREGQTATNPNTKEKLVFRDGKWVPAQ